MSRLYVARGGYRWRKIRCAFTISLSPRPRPATRDRYVDFLRAFAIGMVVVGHWLAVMVTSHDGDLGGEHILAVLPWTQWLTWLVQVMGIFFVVGGYANAASWESACARGDSYAAWLVTRAVRLLRPTTVFIVVGVTLSAIARLAGLDPALVQLAAWLVAISLWFLAVYLVVVALTPPMLTAHRRWGVMVPVAMTVVAAGFDALQLGMGIGYLGVANFLIVWLILPQLGFAWRDGSLTHTPSRPWLLFVGGSVALVLLTTVGPYPVSMVGVPGEAVQNTSPPTVALLALGVAQTGLLVLVAVPMRRWLQRPRVWMAVIAINSVVMTLFLWHMVPVLIAALLLYPTGVIPQPELGSAAWFAWRPVWVLICALLLAVLVAVFRRFERPPRGTPPTAPSPSAGQATPPAPNPLAANLLAAVGAATSSIGIVQLTVGGFQGAGPAHVPLAALLTYAVGLAAFWGAHRVAPRAMPLTKTVQ